MKKRIALGAAVLFFILGNTSCNNAATDQADTDRQDSMATMPANSPADIDTVTNRNPPAVVDTSARKRPADSMPL